MMNDDQIANSPSERTNQLIRLTMIPMARTLARRQRILLAWVIVMAVLSIVGLAVAVVTLGEVIR
jgi:hypothetical protein